MAPREEVESSLPGLKYPSLRDEPWKTGETWLQGKRLDDGAEGLWRIYDDLYDLSSFMDRHPGGKEFLKLTKGTDMTEAFESHHLVDTPRQLLPKYFVKKAKTPRNSPFTFKDDGFYKTLRRRVREVIQSLPVAAYHRKTDFTTDLFFSCMIVLAIIAAATGSYTIGFFSGCFLTFCVVCAHNYSHRRDSLRMYFMNFSLLNTTEWRISHALSHHLYPNSVIDFEISAWEPIFRWLPHKSRTLWQRFGPFIYSPIIYFINWPLNFVTRMIPVFQGDFHELSKQDAIPLILPALMYLFSGASVVDVLLMWGCIIMSGSFVFSTIGLNGAHHHPNIFHDGDAPRNDSDWGLYQMDTVWDRTLISSNTFWVMTNFGHHTLHHLFPTLDHSLLRELYPVFEQTCKEFGIKFRETTIMELFKGQFLQLARNTVNPNPPGEIKKFLNEN